ncbi:MAG: hypothetical protein ABJB16_00400 [Saprospiraceae bacterium]
MNARLITPILYVLILNRLIAQDEQPAIVVSRNNVSKIEAYIFRTPENEPGIDSSLITVEYFNKSGYRTKIEIYDSLGVRTAYEYLYRDDSIRYERRTYFQGKLNSTTKISYYKNGMEDQCIDYDALGFKTGTYSKTNYNKQGEIKDYTVCYNGKYKIKRKNIYDKTGKVIRVIRRSPGQKVQKYDPWKGLSITEETNPNGENVIIRKSKSYHRETVLGLSGALKFEKGDEWERKYFYFRNGLISREEQYKNGIFLGRKKYKYSS